MKIENHWDTIRQIVQEAFKTSQHYAFATANEDGTPHITPIGSLILRGNKTGFFFEEFPDKMRKNFKNNKRVCVLAINAGKFYWLKSLLKGRFAHPPGVRLMGTVGERRKATEEEIAAWQKRVRFAKGLRGYSLLWKNMNWVRDIHFDGFEPVHVGKMTAGLWIQKSEH